MINELYELARVLDDAQVKRQSWHPKYKPIPNIRQNAPCVRIMVSGSELQNLGGVVPSIKELLTDPKDAE